VENVQDVWQFALTKEIVKNPLDLTVKEEDNDKDKDKK
jgi:ATP-dependent Lon protease